MTALPPLAKGANLAVMMLLPPLNIALLYDSQKQNVYVTGMEI